LFLRLGRHTRTIAVIRVDRFHLAGEDLDDDPEWT
jgi:hypothetical protein